MKKLSSIFAAVAFVFAIGVSFASPLLVSIAYYSGGSVTDVQQPDISNCQTTNEGAICTVADTSFQLYDTEGHAAAGGAEGLLRRPM